MNLFDRFIKRKNEKDPLSSMSLDDANARLGEIAEALQLNADTQTEVHLAKMQGRAEDRETNGSMEFLTMEQQRLEKEQERLLAYVYKMTNGLGHSALS